MDIFGSVNNGQQNHWVTTHQWVCWERPYHTDWSLWHGTDAQPMAWGPSATMWACLETLCSEYSERQLLQSIKKKKKIKNQPHFTSFSLGNVSNHSTLKGTKNNKNEKTHSTWLCRKRSAIVWDKTSHSTHSLQRTRTKTITKDGYVKKGQPLCETEPHTVLALCREQEQKWSQCTVM